MKNVKGIGSRLYKDIKEYGFAGIVFLIYYLLVHLFHTAFCPMLSLTGIPCAGCGLTRAFLFMLTGQLKRAAYIQPMAFVVVLFLLYCGYFRYIKGTKIKGFRVLLTALIIVMLIFYGVRMYLYFPDRVPYVYTDNNILAKRIPGYREGIRELIQLIRASRK